MSEQVTMPEAVATAINTVMDKVGYVQKKGVNQFHNYKFAAVGDLLAKLQPAMADAGLIVLQDELQHGLSSDGTIMLATYNFSLAHKSGAMWTAPQRHTGMAAARTSKGGPDDKALNKCHTAARKYFLMALFQIPTGDAADPDEDGDVTTAAPAKSSPPAKQAAPEPAKADDRAAQWCAQVAKKIAACKSVEELQGLDEGLTRTMNDLKAKHPDKHKQMRDLFTARAETLSKELTHV